MTTLCYCLFAAALSNRWRTEIKPVKAQASGKCKPNWLPPVITLKYVLVSLSFCLNPEVAAPSLGQQLVMLEEKLIFDGWISLFDGQTLYGWKSAAEANWKVTEGAITVTEGQVGLLRTSSQFSNFELYLEFKATKDTNSGIFIRTPPKPKNPQIDCYEINIAPADNPFPTASLVGRQTTTISHQNNHWHAFEISAVGSSIRIALDGKTITEYVDPNPLGRGYIGLQHNSGAVAFRNIRIKPLGLVPVFNGINLDGWRQHPTSKSKFSVTDKGELNVKGGKGQLETVQSYGDFVMQLECITHANGLNSGIFYRCIPGDVMMGYEIQIDNTITDGNPTQPANCGTGGIFRRRDARRVTSLDHQWFAMTIATAGPHVAVWVNGFHVADWTDQRNPHNNPRKGIRLAPGTIMLQGHDPTTNLSFRQLRITELADRNY